MFRTIARLAFLSLAPFAAAQSTWYVDAAAVGPGDGSSSNPFKSLQFAIGQPTTVAGDTLLVLPGSYAEAIDYVGKTLAIKSTLGPFRTILQGSVFDASSIVRATSGEGSGTSLEGFTLRQGAGSLVGAEALGGAIYVAGSSLEVRNCIVRDNGVRAGTPALVTSGGAIHAENATLVCVDSTIHGNVIGGGQGAGVHLVDSTATFRRTGFAFNRVLSCPTNCGRGGGLWFGGGTLTVEDCWFQQNFSGGGGGLHVESGTAQILRSRLEINQTEGGLTSPGWGAGLSAEALAVVTASRCVFANNSAQSAGAFGAGAGGVSGATLENCVISGNSADLAGLPNVGTAVQNCALENCIVWNNASSSPALGGTSSATYCDVQDSVAGTGNFSLDPRYYDESVADYHLLGSSACVDAGNPASAPDPDGSTADIGVHPFDALYAGGPQVYCTAKVNSLGCLPAIQHNNFAPSVSGPPLVVFATSALGEQNGLLFWGTLPGSFPFLGGTLCIGSSLTRAQIQQSGGNAASCSGTLYFAWSAAYLADQGLVAGNAVYCQFWYRDPSDVDTVGLTNALSFQLVP